MVPGYPGTELTLTCPQSCRQPQQSQLTERLVITQLISLDVNCAQNKELKNVLSNTCILLIRKLKNHFVKKKTRIFDKIVTVKFDITFVNCHSAKPISLQKNKKKITMYFLLFICFKFLKIEHKHLMIEKIRPS